MYNRYVRNDTGGYERCPQADPSCSSAADEAGSPEVTFSRPERSCPQGRAAQDNSPQTEPPRQVPLPRPGELRFLDRLLSRLHLGDIDSGDLLLLLLLFLLFREDGDEELLIAIGLLLIL